MINQKKYFRFLSLVLIIMAFLPIVSENLPRGIGSFRFLWAPLWLLSLAIFQGKVFYNRVLLRFFVYALSLAILIPTIWFNMDDWLVRYIGEEFYWMITIASVLYYYVTTKDYQGLAINIKWALVCIGITAMISIIATFINPMYARLLTSSSSGFLDTAEGNFFIKLGAGQYSFGQSLICVFPILIYYYKQNQKVSFSKWIILLYIFLLYLTTIRMQFFANILLASVIIVVSFLGSKRIKLSVFVTILVFVAATIIPKEYYANMLLSTRNYFDVKSENYSKMTDMAQFITTGDMETGSVGGRLLRYPDLYKAFAKNPVWGNAAAQNPDDIRSGYHLHWMGKLGATGIFGLLLFFYPHFFFIKAWFKRFNNEYAFFAGISIVAFFALGLMKTIAGRDIWFTYFFIIPGMYYLPLLNQQNDVQLDI